MIRAVWDYVFIEIEGSLFNQDSGFKGINGQSIEIDPSYDPQLHVKICGTVVSVPEQLSQRPIAQETNGIPSYNWGNNFRYKYMSDIAPEVQVGDRVYFHFNTLIAREGDKYLKNLVKDNIFKVSYENIICAVRDEEIIMIGGYCLIKPDIESWEETLIPVPERINGEIVVDKQGNPVLKPKKDWIVAKLQPEERYLKGFVVNVGTPLKGDDLTLQKGDAIIYRTNADWRQRIEGKEYFVIRQRHIIGYDRDKAIVFEKNSA